MKGYEVYMYKNFNSRKGKLAGTKKTLKEAIELGANYPEPALFNIWDIEKEDWVEF